MNKCPKCEGNGVRYEVLIGGIPAYSCIFCGWTNSMYDNTVNKNFTPLKQKRKTRQMVYSDENAKLKSRILQIQDTIDFKKEYTVMELSKMLDVHRNYLSTQLARKELIGVKKRIQKMALGGWKHVGSQWFVTGQAVIDFANTRSLQKKVFKGISLKQALSMVKSLIVTDYNYSVNDIIELCGITRTTILKTINNNQIKARKKRVVMEMSNNVKIHRKSWFVEGNNLLEFIRGN